MHSDVCSGREGPEFCRDREDDDSDGDGSCDDNSVCTASVNCWDGDMEIAEDIEEFTGEDIEDQGGLSSTASNYGQIWKLSCDTAVMSQEDVM